VITIRGLTKTFNDGSKKAFRAVDSISLDLPDKGLVVMLGASGSGKTTLLNLLGGLDVPDAGTITYDGAVYGKGDSRAWDALRRNDVSHIFQNYELIGHMSVFDNVALPLKMLGIDDPEAIGLKVRHALSAVGLDNFLNRRASELSGGQRQRVAIARAIVKNPKVIFADEPTGNLDSVNTVQIIKMIKAISKERLVVLVTHETEIANYYADRIISLADGRITGDKENETKVRFDVEDNDLIILSDYTMVDQSGQIRYFSDDDNGRDMDIRLIRKGDTLFVDVRGGVRKVRLVDDDKRIVERPEDLPDPLEDTSFSESELSLDGLRRAKTPRVLTVKDALKTAFGRLKTMFVSGKVMLAGLLFAGMIVAFSASIVGNYFFNREVFVEELEENIMLFKQTYGIDYDVVLGAAADDASVWINPYQNTTIPVTIPSITGETATYNLEGLIDLVDHIGDRTLVSGRFPSNDNEFVIDIRVFEETNGRYNTLTRYGIWDERQLIGETVDVDGVTMRLSGIVDTRAQRIYATRNGATVLARASSVVARSYLSYDRFKDAVTVVHGKMPEPGSRELLAPATWMGTIIPYFAFNDDTNHRYRTFVLSGTYDVDTLDMGITPFIGYTEDIEYYMYLSSIGDVTIRTDNPLEMTENLRELGFDADWNYGSSVSAAVNTSRKLLPILFVSLFIVLLSGIGVFFMMRSSMLSRMHDMGVMRALGMPAGKIRRAFMVEVFVLTSASTLVGYIIGILLVLRTENVTILTYMVYMNTISALLGALFLYLSNGLFGMMSIGRLMRTSTADLFRRYDM
jgi:putative ABC transport system permease protein